MTAELRLSAFVFLVVSTFWLLLIGIGIWPFVVAPYASNVLLFVASWFLVASMQMLWMLGRRRPDRPLSFLRNEVFGADYHRRFRQVLPVLIAAAIFTPAFSSMKSAIPLFSDYRWDQAFIEADVLIHGTDAWRLLQPILGYPIVTSFLSTAYQLWLLLLYAGVIYFALYVDSRLLRLRYFAAFFGIWIVNGVVLATIFASVGPCFLDAMIGNWHFSEQTAYLIGASEQYPVMSVEVQQQLIAWYSKGSNGLGRGISAMPSMHVSLAFLFFLAMRHVSRNLGIFFFLFFVLILIGSVHLGYHYAVDGYVSIIVTGAIWMACGRMFRASAEREPTTSV